MKKIIILKIIKILKTIASTQWRFEGIGMRLMDLKDPIT
jgi:hypothetical protein